MSSALSQSTGPRSDIENDLSKDDRVRGFKGIQVRTIIVPMIVVQAAVLYLVLRNSSWVFDDNFWLIRAGEEGFTWHWLNTPQFEHWNMGMNALTSLEHLIFFFDYRWALLFLLCLLGGSVYVFERCLAMVIDDRRLTILLAFWFGLNILWVRPLQWWSAGVQYFPYTFFDLLCLYGFLRYQAGGGVRWIAASALALAAALLFYEKPAYMLLYLALIRIFLMSADLRPRAVVASFWRERTIWLAYLVVIGLWGIGYLHAHAYSSHGGVSISQYLSYFRILWLQTLVPSLASVTIPATNLDALQVLFVVVAQIVVLAGVCISLRRKRSAWRGWVFLVIVVLISGALVAGTRIPIFGVEIANDPRYLIDFSWLVPIALCAAFAPSSILEPKVPVRSAHIRLPGRKLLSLTTASMVLVYAVVAVASAAHLEAIWPGSKARTWDNQVRKGIAEARRLGGTPVVANDVTPPEVVAEWVAPYNRLSRILPMYVGSVKVDGPLDGPLFRIGADGAVRRATAIAVDGHGSSTASNFSNLIHIGSGGRVVRSGGGYCVIADASPVVVERRLSSAPSPAGGPYYVLLHYRVWRTLALALVTDVGSGYPSEANNTIELSPGVGSSIAWVGITPKESPHAVKILIPPLTTVCVDGFEIVRLQNGK